MHIGNKQGMSVQFPKMALSSSLWHLPTKDSDFRDMTAKPTHAQYTMANTHTQGTERPMANAHTVHEDANGQ